MWIILKRESGLSFGTSTDISLIISPCYLVNLAAQNLAQHFSSVNPVTKVSFVNEVNFLTGSVNLNSSKKSVQYVHSWSSY